MGHALERVEDCEILIANPKLTFADGRYNYTITRENTRSIYSVTDGTQTLSVPIAWAFGLGAAGQTYVFQREGIWYESRVSFYKAIGTLDLTMGARNNAPKDINQAAGRAMSSKDAVECFGCHASGAVHDRKLDVQSLVPGVHCDTCHGSADRHVRALKTGDVNAARMRKLSTAGTEEISELCGSCHRTWAQIAANGPQGIGNVRFQPYRLTNSKCYDAADRRISCTACHDPHQDPVHSASAYDAKCIACHSAANAPAGAKLCHVSKSNCVTCHMPKYDLPGAHNKFTDHQIRIVRANEPYPN